jgi:hypothetical protein
MPPNRLAHVEHLELHESRTWHVKFVEDTSQGNIGVGRGGVPKPKTVALRGEARPWLLPFLSASRSKISDVAFVATS